MSGFVEAGLRRSFARIFGTAGYKFVVQLCIRPPKRARSSDCTRSIVQLGFQSRDNSAHPSGLAFNRTPSPMALSPKTRALDLAISQLLFIRPGAMSFPTSTSAAVGAFQNQHCRRQPTLSKTCYQSRIEPVGIRGCNRRGHVVAHAMNLTVMRGTCLTLFYGTQYRPRRLVSGD